ncbi:tetraprenyl-beta-curcumene synthase family protein [Oceanobacillus salinisoli]|uniref:tetraprenyl-beta-curcumene synthase family protein n=1 Tax=Oceanobacillus salinisoli TaxID=2678611 RepID=UPI0012E159B8|nr:tetraprenyl-beta-curcumene synthase family protein [Oceanobacillus salinisoli]
MSHVPTTSLTLVTTVFRKIFPAVNEELHKWRSQAEQIPNKELRTQALNSINSKRFHCQGGAVFALLAEEKWREAVRFIVAYQTISDYLDNLCDRSTSLNPDDFELLHLAMEDALTPGNECKNYYELRDDQDDGNYLKELVQTCQQVINRLGKREAVTVPLLRLEEMYANLQVHKHVKVDERIPRLTNWYEGNKEQAPTLSWYEYAAAAGSTLGIFCLASYALSDRMTEQLTKDVFHSYFPYMQGLHILLDYFIDQNEDIEEGDLNFCSFYTNNKEMRERFAYFIKQADQRVQSLPNSQFHKMIHHGLVGLYLGDKKVMTIEGGAGLARELLEISGGSAKFFHWNTKLYYKFNKKRSAG